MKLRHIVITSVTRDDLADGGAAHFAECIRAVRQTMPAATVEVLTPDFKGSRDAVAVVLAAAPDVFNHNVETVRRLTKQVRIQASYERSLQVLRTAAEIDPSLPTKSGIMAGLGESDGEVIETLRDLRGAGVSIVTIGQYMRPSAAHLPVERWVTPEEFAWFKDRALEMGFRHVESGPLVRSSYHAAQALSG